MSLKQLADQIWSDQALRAEIVDLAVESAQVDLPTSGLQFGREERDWFRLLRCGTVFLDADDETYHDAALRIVHACLVSDADLNAKGLAVALLAKAASNPTIDVAIRRNLVPSDVLARLPFNLHLDVVSRQLASTVNIDTPREFIGNEFQNRLWAALAEYDWVSASAPTSVGKSFILEKWIEHAVATLATSTTFYVVPTRALIAQVEADLRRILPADRDDISITSLPLAVHKPTTHNIFVYTQERLHLYTL